VLLCVLVVIAALDEAARAVPDADDRYADLAVAATPGARPRVARIRPVLAVASVLGHDVSPLLLLDRGDVGRLGLAADMKDPLDDCDDGADEDDAEGELDRRRA